jgi:hypothetical protein
MELELELELEGMVPHVDYKDYLHKMNKVFVP